MAEEYKDPAQLESEIGALRQQLEAATRGTLTRIECNPESIEQGLAKLVLGLIELLRRLLERQAVRRMEGGSLTPQQIEEMGQSLMKLEQKIQELAANFGLTPEDLNLELGPLSTVGTK